MIHENFMNKYGNGQLPSRPEVPGQKDESYYLRMCQYFMSNLANDTGTLIFAQSLNRGASRRSNKELRDYARGLQTIDKYLLQMGYEPDEIRKFRKSHISHQPIPLYPKFRNIMISKFLDLNLKAVPVATNEQARYERLMAKNKMKFLSDSRTRERVPTGMLPPMEPGVNNPEDVEYLYEIGGIQLPIELALQEALNYTLDNNEFESVAKMMIEDIIDLGGMACDLRSINGKQKIDYVDYGRVIARSSIYSDFRDSDVRGYTVQRKISDILMEDEDKIRRHWDQIKQAYHGHVGLDTYNYRSQTSGYREDYAGSANPLQGYSDFGVTVLKLYWLDTEDEHYVVGRHARGNQIFEKVNPDFNLSDRAKRAGKRMETYTIQYMYQANWIVGTDIVYGYGKVDNIVRQGEPGASQIIWPMMIYSSQEPSMTEKVIPFLDDLQLAILKRRDLIAKMPPGPRMLVYKNRIRDSVNLGKKTYNIRQILKMYQRDGLLILDEEDDYSLPGEANSSQKPPVEFMPSGIAEDLQILENTIAVSIDRIQQVTGINPVVDGTATKGDILKSVAESMQRSANNVLRPWMVDYIHFYQRMSENIAWRYQVGTIHGDIEIEYTPLNTSFSKFVSLGRDLLRYDLSIRVETADNDYYQFLLQDLLAKRELLPAESYFAIYNAIRNRDLKKAEWLLVKFTRQAKAEEQAAQERLMEIQSEQNARAGMAVEQAKAQAEMEKLRAEIQRMREQAGLDENKAQRDHAREIEKILVKAKKEGEANVDVVRENKQNSIFTTDNK